MGIRRYKPTTPGRRGASGSDYADVTRARPEKSLTRAIKSSGGRNAYGRTTSRYRGGGNKRRYRAIDFRRNKDGIPAKVFSIEYDPNRNARIALLHYHDGEKRYILAPDKLRVGDVIESGEGADIKPGNALPLRNIPIGTIVHGVELRPGGGAKIARSAGTYAQIVGRDGEYVILRLNSTEQRLVHGRCLASIGAVSNPDNMNISIGKAGRTRWMGWRGHVRGETMNPVDHPLGGRTRGGRHPVTPWGQPTKGKKTRKNKSTTKFIMLSRHARKK